MSKLYVNKDEISKDPLSNQLEISGTRVGSSKVGLDVYPAAGDPYLDLVRTHLLGDQPEPNYNSMSKAVASSVITYGFKLDGVRQFSIALSNLSTTTLTTSSIIHAAIAKEDAFAVLQENGDELLKENP